MEGRFEGKAALVTGAATGIGQATAVRLAAEGAADAAGHRPGTDPGQTLAQIEAADGRGFAAAADMRDPAQVVAMAPEVGGRLGRLDFVVFNAAVNPLMTWDETAIDDFNELSDTNVRGTWVVCTEGAKQVIRGGTAARSCARARSRRTWARRARPCTAAPRARSACRPRRTAGTWASTASG